MTDEESGSEQKKLFDNGIKEKKGREKFNICFISNFFPPASVSGADRYLWDVSHELAKRGNQVDVVTLAPLGETKNKIERKKNLTIHRLVYLNPANNQDEREKARYLIKYLERVIKKRKIEIISSQALHLWDSLSPPFCSIVSNMVAIKYNISNILTVHAPLNREMIKIAPRVLMWDKIIGVSNSISEEIHNLGVPIDKIATSYPGVNLENFRSELGKKWLRSRTELREKDLVILFAGRISEPKGVPTLLKAFSIASQDKKDLKLLLAAARPPNLTNDEFEEIISKAKEKAKLLGIEKKIIIHPFDLEEMPLVYNGADLFVMPSQYEAFGLVYAEAAACGLPVIGSSVGGIPEIIVNGENGYLVPPDEPIELAKSIQAMLRNSKKMKSMAKHGKERVIQKFDLNKTIDRLSGIYRSTLNKKE